jgi:hypothetical protein
MARIDSRRDGVVLAMGVGMTAMLVAALVGSPEAFGYSLVGVLGLFMGLGFVRAHDPVTWLPPAVATLVLLLATTGIFVYDDTTVASADDTVGGFQTGTAFLVYGLWIPAFFTLGVGFSLVFDRLSDDDAADPGSSS